MPMATGITVTNQDIAKILREIAELLEIKGETYFKTLAYTRAADTVDKLDFNLSEVKGEEELRQIKNIGSSIARNIWEILQDRECQKHRELLLQFPPTLLELLEIPGLGPKRAKALFESRGVRSIEDLVVLIKDQGLRDLPGFGEKTEQNILRGIEQYRRHRERLTIFRADSISRRIVEELRRRTGLELISPAGSLRRMRDTIGDIDILAGSAERPYVIGEFCNLSSAYEVLARGDTKSSIRTADGIQIDLRVVERDRYGSALMYFTGSKEHNVQVREIAVALGYKLNEYGLFERASDRLVVSATEEEIYGRLGLQFVHPYLREARGEVEMAKEGKLPRIVSLEEVRGDLHVHSTYTDGGNSIEEMALEAKRMGYEYVGLTDHALNLKVASGLTVEVLKRQFEEIDYLNEKLGGIRILKGSELNIGLDGSVDYDPEILAQFDFTVASIHGGFGRSREEQTQRLIRAMENPYVTIIGHLTGRIINKREPYQLDLEAVLEKAAETGTILEINSFPDRLDLKDDDIFRARRYGIIFSLGTDAHSTQHMELIRFGVATAGRGWLEKKDLINTYPLPELLKIFGRKRARL
ncbi:DNA polymerase (family X) [Candidatus Hakubella thermalkaliphila]|uniref:DNA-directed DNA polymerase n=1 Tax=Candidatus Hakubella thermalkaliphila TaxID=2754717 RepID=A0A6V8PNN3_9ACTN|nr:DNA polymerase (family X) [Candidatus Hakubella thermalkaliphila]GFP41603.1 DNA polymerase (family X) [Candidatus Hakubella thermalkaliphila]